MESTFPKAHDVHTQLLNDRNDYLYASDRCLIEKIQSLMRELVASRPKCYVTARKQLEYQYKELRLQTLLGLIDPHGVFKAQVSYEAELCAELEASGYSCMQAAGADNIMEVLTLIAY